MQWKFAQFHSLDIHVNIVMKIAKLFSKRNGVLHCIVNRIIDAVDEYNIEY